MKRPAPARRSRLADAARLLPFLGVALLVLPVPLLPDMSPRASVGWLVWLFGAWAATLALAAWVARLRTRQSDEGEAP